MTKRYSKRYKAKVKRENNEAYKNAVRDRIAENAKFFCMSVSEYTRQFSGEHDIW